MKRKYAEKVALMDLGVEHVFTPGDQVFLLQRRVGKTLPKAVGPMRFVKYWGDMKLTT